MDNSDRTFRVFFEYSTNGMLIINAEGDILDANAAACRLFSVAHKQLCTSNYGLLTTDNRINLLKLIDEAEKCGKVTVNLDFRRNEDELFSGTVNVLLMDNAPQAKRLLGLIITDTADIEKVNDDTGQSYKQMVQLAKEGIWVYDENHVTTFVSDALCRMLGYERHEMVGRDILCFIDDKRSEQAKENLERRKNGITEQFDFALLTKSGELRWTIVNTSPVFKEGRYTGAIAVLTDVTARRMAEKDVYDREDRYRAMVENSYDAILLLDEELRTVYRSPSTTSIMGFKDDERLGQSYLELTHPDDVDKLKGLQQMVLNHPGRSIPITVRAKHSNGHYLWFIGVATNLLHEKNVHGIVVNLRDISERKKAEDDLKHLSNRLQLATQATNICIADWDIRNNYVTYDDCMFDLYQIDPDKFKHRFDSWVDRLHPEDRSRITNEIDAALVNQNDFKLEFRITLPDGEIKHIIAMCIIERDVTGHAIRIVATNQDATAQVRASQERERLITELIERNKALEQFAYIVSHNLRAPVANLMSLTDMSTDTDLSEADRNEINIGLKQSVTKIDQIINDLNEIFQSKQHLYDHKETVELQAIINDIQFSIKDLIIREKVTIHCNFSENCTVYTTRLYLYSILFNIILNAIKYRKPDVPPVINVTGTHQNGSLNVTIIDNGRGIDLQRYGDKLFGLYKRFDYTVEGRGIGLYMVKTQVEALGGRIEVESQPGDGSQFSVFIPLNS